MIKFAAGPFVPAFGMKGAHSQIIGARFLRPSKGVSLARTRVETPDGDFLNLDFARVGKVDADSSGRIVLVLHGLEGSAESKYALETYRRLAGFGIAAVGLNFRSCGGEMNVASRLYHSGETDDPRFVLNWLASKYPSHQISAVGFSLGGNVLLKYLGEGCELPANFRSGAAVSVPYDLSAGADYLERGLGRFYRRRLLRSLRAKVFCKAPQIRALVDLDAVKRSVTFREFDDAATAPLHGFSGVDDYYASSSSKQFLHKIGLPTLLVHADDDPFLPPSAVPRDEVRGNSNLTGLFTQRGGHVGFLSGHPGAPRFWAEENVARFLAAQMPV